MSMWMILRIRPWSIGICYPIWDRPRDQVFIESSRLRCTNSGATISTCHEGAQVNAEKENSCSPPVDQRRPASPEGALESEDARGRGREGDETNRGSGTAKGKDDRHRSRSSTLTTRTVCFRAGALNCRGIVATGTRVHSRRPPGGADSNLNALGDEFG